MFVCVRYPVLVVSSALAVAISSKNVCMYVYVPTYLRTYVIKFPLLEYFGRYEGEGHNVLPPPPPMLSVPKKAWVNRVKKTFKLCCCCCVKNQYFICTIKNALHLNPPPPPPPPSPYVQWTFFQGKSICESSLNVK